MSNWDGSISHGKQLIQAAWLEAGRHEENVTARQNAMCDRNAEAHPAPAPGSAAPSPPHLPALHHHLPNAGLGQHDSDSDIAISYKCTESKPGTNGWEAAPT